MSAEKDIATILEVLVKEHVVPAAERVAREEASKNVDYALRFYIRELSEIAIRDLIKEEVRKQVIVTVKVRGVDC